jgi:hypothetical protein
MKLKNNGAKTQDIADLLTQKKMKPLYLSPKLYEVILETAKEIGADSPAEFLETILLDTVPTQVTILENSLTVTYAWLEAKLTQIQELGGELKAGELAWLESRERSRTVH